MLHRLREEYYRESNIPDHLKLENFKIGQVLYIDQTRNNKQFRAAVVVGESYEEVNHSFYDPYDNRYEVCIEVYFLGGKKRTLGQFDKFILPNLKKLEGLKNSYKSLHDLREGDYVNVKSRTYDGDTYAAKIVEIIPGLIPLYWVADPGTGDVAFDPIEGRNIVSKIEGENLTYLLLTL